MKIVIATGGTGGHIYPALALADAAMRKDPACEILFIGNEDRMESKEVPAAGYRFVGLQAQGLTGSVVNKAQSILKMGQCTLKARNILKEFKPDIAIGFGGYVSAPVMMAAKSLGIKVMLHEQNSIIGKANKLCAKFADAIVICYEKCFEQLDRNKTRLLGNPRASLALQNNFDQEYYDSLGLDPTKQLVLVVMGSLGSTTVNEAMIEALPELKNDCEILFVCGRGNLDSVSSKFNKKNIHVVEYIRQSAIIEKVDCMVCRAGATTAAEICAFGVPSVIVPSPYVANNHQYYNAMVLVEQKCAFMIEEKDLNSKTLFEKCSRILNNPKLKEEMKQNALKHGFVHACDDILDWCYEMAGEKK